MTAIDVEGGTGAASALRPVRIPVPHLGEGEILIKVAAAGINRPDLFQRMGYYPPPPGAPATLGLEVAGEVVVAAGRWNVGDRVCALLGGGGYAEYAACDARHALPVPANLSLIEAASLPETVFTVFANVFESGSLRSGETLLLHGATSGIGVTAIQMAKAAGARVIATARGVGKAAIARTLGADIVIEASSEDFAASTIAAGGADVVLDMVGGEYFARNLLALNHRGRIVFIATLGGNDIVVPIMALMQKQATLTGSTLRARPSEEKARLAAAVEATVWPWISQGRFKPMIDATFSLLDAATAHAHLERGSHVGKIVLTVA
ncbi:NAD(P)H-quinone oxidoreductase [Sphingosinicellaceae bacterium]|nr:NAD(P)H-quinone oxidoreductase [Sphingosinicellaceae bacterium]